MKKTAAALAAATTLALLAPAGASAETEVVTDPRGDSYSGADYEPGPPSSSDWGDITRVVLEHTRQRFSVVVRLNPATYPPDLYEARLDTRPGRPGPELQVFFGVDAYDDDLPPYVTLYRMNGITEIRCKGARSKALGSAGGKAGHRISIPRSCLGNPRKVRVKLTSGQEHGYDDHAPGRAKPRWSPWVRRG
ncbi:hypothetical protein [Nocardioides sp. SYSU D00038]|uniref:hypothetical protein n=1 Tax=Nocardioides sp. SYSU D00038 TaxID=2812554 RepID=UPI0019685882|nr:hypothetical protein [Nocardioides sp. SYSU D00038]